MVRLSSAGPLLPLLLMMVCLGGAFIVLEVLLPRVWGYDLAVSPWWQVSLHHLTLGVVFPAGFAVMLDDCEIKIRVPLGCCLIEAWGESRVARGVRFWHIV